jgi:peptide/nickel transport system permease protein
MRFYATYLAQRLGQFLLVVFIGINLTYLITHLTPIDPIEQSIAAVTSFGNTSPEAIGAMRQSLRELYGLTGAPHEQYLAFWRRIATADFGPSLSAFPTPVSTLLTWVLGNLLGGLAGYYQNKTSLKVLAIIAMGLHPVPYYIVAFVLLVMFGYLWPLLPIAGGKAMNLGDQLNLTIVLSILKHSILPALSLLLVGLGGWFLGMRSLVSNIVSEDYVVYAELAGVDRRRILTSYVMRNALLPQVTGLALSLGAIFNGAIITEQVFGYPGVGSLLVSGVYAGDYGLVLGVATVSIIGVSTAVLIIDLLYPLLDPRVRTG